MARVHLIDASPYIFRAFYSLPHSIKSPAGKPANATYGYTEFLIQVLKKEEPTHVVVAFDGSLTTSFRSEIYAEYKAQRKEPPSELKEQIEDCFRVTEAMGMTALIDDRYEADDIIGTLTMELRKEDYGIVIISNDKDLLQFVNQKVTFWDFARDERYDAEKVKDKLGVAPEQITDFLALSGDSVDNIPGVKGIGQKTAALLLSHFSDMEEIYTNLDAVDSLSVRAAKAIRNKLQEEKEMAQISKQLATIALDAPVDVDLKSFEYRGANRTEIASLFDELGFGDIRERIPKWRESQK